MKFEVDGEAVTLTVYRSVDETTGNESYSDGRYLDLLYSGYGPLVLDFNFSYNPCCAYDPD